MTVGWKTYKLIDVTTKIGSGATPKGGSKSYKTEGVSLIRSLNVYDGYFKKEKLAFIDEDQAGKLSNVIIEENDVLLNITGASVARCCVVPSEYLPARVNQHVSIIRPIPEVVDSKFLSMLLYSKEYKSRLLDDGEKAGSTRQALTKTQLQNFEVRIPPIAEQKRIVAILDEAFAGIDQAIANTERNLANARELFDSKKLTVFEKIDQDSKKPLTEICDAIFAGGDAPKNKMSKVRTGEFDVPIYANAVKNRGLYGYTSEARAKAPSITVAARGSGTGHVEIRSEPFLPIVRLIVLTPMSEMIQPEYFYHALKSLEILRSGSAIPQLTVPMMKSYAIPVPSLAEQNEIVEQINKIASETKTLNEVYCNKLGALGELKQSLLQKAFTGELTADWRKQHSTTNAL